jgi:hypothetical protein
MDKGTKVNNKKKRDQNKAIKKKDDKKLWHINTRGILQEKRGPEKA